MTTYFQLQNVKMDKTKYVPRLSIGNLFMKQAYNHTQRFFPLFIVF